MSDVLVVGVGNTLRGDDAAGPLVARRLADAGVRAVPFAGEPVGLLDLWAGARAVVLVDAVRSGGEPGTLHRWDASAAPLPAALGGSTSTHAVGLGDAVELARALDRLPGRLVVLGVEGSCFDTGAALSPAVAAALEPLAAAAREEALGLGGTPGSPQRAPHSGGGGSAAALPGGPEGARTSSRP